MTSASTSERFPPRAVLGVISSAKSDMVDVAAFDERAGTIYERRIAQAYAEYERRLVAANAMDFDDLLVRTVRMFREHPDVLEHYQERFEHVLVDEYQDTNIAQNELVIQLGRGPAATSVSWATPTRASTGSGVPRCATCSSSSARSPMPA